MHTRSGLKTYLTQGYCTCVSARDVGMDEVVEEGEEATEEPSLVGDQ